ncbi:MAG: hypothetical protein LQ340_004248 [Diploschistes diacapsis]|nr:MAG: hypothetical protein LQ340_004248 [Diploschistes diacapsis]
MADSWKPGQAQPEVRIHGDYYRPKRALPEDDEKDAELPPCSRKRRRTRKIQPEMPKLTKTDRSPLKPRDPNSKWGLQLVSVPSKTSRTPKAPKAMVIRTRQLSATERKYEKNTKKTGDADLSVARTFETVRRKLELAEWGLKEDKALLRECWDAEPCLQRMELMEGLEELAESMHRAEVSLGTAIGAVEGVHKRL